MICLHSKSGKKNIHHEDRAISHGELDNNKLVQKCLKCSIMFCSLIALSTQLKCSVNLQGLVGWDVFAF